MEITSFEQWSYDFCGKSMEITLWKINEVLRKYLETMISIKQHWTPWFLKFPCLLSFVMLLPFLFHLRQPRQWTATTSKIMKNHLNICRCLNICKYIYMSNKCIYIKYYIFPYYHLYCGLEINVFPDQWPKSGYAVAKIVFHSWTNICGWVPCVPTNGLPNMFVFPTSTHENGMLLVSTDRD